MSGPAEQHARPRCACRSPSCWPERRAVRDDAHGRRVTYSPKVFIPLTMLCRDRCGYCTFAQPPARLESPYLTPDQVLAIARAGAAAGCHEALFTLGEGPEERYPVAARVARRARLRVHRRLPRRHVPARARRDRPAPPRQRRRARPATSSPRLRAVAPSQGMMVESLRDDLDCHRGAPDKVPARRLATLEAAGRARHPVHHRHPRRHRRGRGRPHRRRSRPSPPRTAATATCRR